MIRALSETQFIGTMSIGERMEKIWEPFIKQCDEVVNQGLDMDVWMQAKGEMIELMRKEIKARIGKINQLLCKPDLCKDTLNIELGTLQAKLERLGE